MLSEKECIQKAEAAYPMYKVAFGFMHKGFFIVNIVPKNHSGREMNFDFHAVDPNSGEVSGNMGTMSLMSDDEFVEKLWNATGSAKSEEPEHIEHHGIKGQHWGEKNGPPYPLDQKTHNEVVKSASNSDKKK